MTGDGGEQAGNQHMWQKLANELLVGSGIDARVIRNIEPGRIYRVDVMLERDQ